MPAGALKKGLQALSRHIRVQVAHAACVELDRGNTGGQHGPCVHVGINVRFHDTPLNAIFHITV